MGEATITRSSIGPTDSRLVECSICEELGSAAAEDRATGGVYCGECIGYALNAEMLMRVAWVNVNVRHPHPNEFAEWEDH